MVQVAHLNAERGTRNAEPIGLIGPIGLILLLLTGSLSAQPAVKSFITVAQMVAANPYQVADPTPSGGRTATVMVQETAGAYALTNTWTGTNTSTLIASSTSPWAWALLPIASGPNFYTSDGTLNGPRKVSLGTQPLIWQGPGAITSSNLNSYLVYANGAVGLSSPTDMGLTAGQRLLLRTPLVSSSTAKAGDALTLINVATGESEYRAPPTAATLYTADGSLTSNRVVTLASKSLTFKGPGPVTFDPVDTFGVNASQYAVMKSAGNVILESPGLMSIRTPNVVAGGAQAGQVLTLSGANGVVEFAPVSVGGSGTNIYNSNGTLTGNRTVDTTNFNLTFQGTGILQAKEGDVDLRGNTAEFVANTTTVAGTNQLRLRTPNTLNSSAANGQVLTLLDVTTGRVEYQTPTPLPTVNIYNQDGTLSSDRTVAGGSRNLIFTNVNTFGAAGQTAVLRAGTALGLVTPNVISATATSGQALTLQDATTGRVEYSTVPNIYTVDSTLTTSRNVNGGGRSLAFNSINNFTADTTNLSLFAKGSFNVATPHVLGIGGSAAAGQVLTLQDSGTGRVEYQTPANPTPINIYNSNGFLTTNRTLTTLTNTLTIDATSSPLVHIYNANQFTSSAKTNSMYASLEASMGSVGRVILFTPRFGAGAANGQVLTMLDSANALVDFHPPYNLYNTNGTLTGDRIVDGNFRELAFTNFNHFSGRGRTSTISGSIELRVRTPNVAGGLATTNQVLTLLDSTTGRSEFVALPSAPADINVYSNSGTISASRTITVPDGMFFRTLGTAGQNSSTILNTPINNISGATNYFIASDTLLLAATAASAKFQVRTPRFYSGAAKDGDVLMMVNRAGGLGDTDYYTPTNIYNNNGTLTSTRTITGGGNSVILSGLNVFQTAGNTFRAYTAGGGEMILATPKIMGSNAPPYPAVNGWVLTLQDAASGRVEYAPLPNPGGSTGDFSSIYANDGTISTNLVNATRNVNFPAVRLLFRGDQNPTTGGAFDVVTDAGGNGRFSATGATNSLFGSKRMEIGGGVATVIQTPGTYANAASRAGWVLAWDGSKSEYVPTVSVADTSIYNTNGTLSGNRTLTGANFDLAFNNINNLDLRGVATTIEGSSALRMRTPSVATATAGQVLALQASDGTGRVEFNTLTNLYTADGTLSGNRTVSQGAANLIFSGTGNFTASGQSQLTLSPVNATISGSTQLHLESAGRIDLATPKVRNATALNGQVLTLMDQDIGRVEYATPIDTSIYNTNGALSADRIVTLNSKTLTFQGFGNVNLATLGTFDVGAVSRAKLASSGEMEIGGQSVLRIRTPKVQAGAGAVSVGQILVLTNVDGSVEFQSLPGTSSSPLQFESPLTDTSTAVNPTTLWFGVGTLNPPYTGSLPEPVNGTRLVGRLTRPNAPGGWSNTGSGTISLNFPINPASGGDHTYERFICKPDGSELGAGALKEGTAVDLIFFRNWSGTGVGKWVMVNAGYAALTMADGFSVTNSLSSRVTTVSFAGVVDVFADLADVPLTFKKVSTLGNASVGDHGHADYYLTAYDPAISGAISVRSSVDATKMWRRLE